MFIYVILRGGHIQQAFELFYEQSVFGSFGSFDPAEDARDFSVDAYVYKIEEIFAGIEGTWLLEIS